MFLTVYYFAKLVIRTITENPAVTCADKHNRNFTREKFALQLGAVDFAALETGGELAGCFQPRRRIGDGFVDRKRRSFLTDGGFR